MHFHLRRLLSAEVCLALVAVTATTVHTANVVAHSAGASQEHAQLASSQQTLVYRQTVRIWVHPDGVRPAVVHAAPGPLSIQAENETGADVALVIERASEGQTAAHRVGRVAASRRGRRARQEMELGAGEYVFYEESRPQFTGTLIIEPRDK